MAQPQYNLTVKANGTLRVLQSECEICAAFDPTMTNAASIPPMLKFTAVWDTGATNSVITQEVVDKLGLKGSGIKEVHGVHGTEQSESYLVNLRLPNRVGFAGIRVTLGKLPAGSQALIGMDIISLGDFAVTNLNGKTVFSFRCPSIACIDFVDELNKKQRGRVGGPGGFGGGRHKGGRHKRR